MRFATLLLLLCGPALAGDAPHPANGMPPAGRVSLDEAIRGAVEFLVTHQNKDGSFGRAASPVRYQLWCHVPGGHQAFQGASTALAWMGLRASPYQTDASKAAQARCLAWMVDHVHVKRPFPEQFYNTWSLAYGLRALALALETKAPGAEPEKIRAAMRGILETLAVMQSPDGGWGYLDFNVPARKPSWSTSFTTATVVIALRMAEEQGVAIPPGMVDKAIRLLWRLRTPDGNYVYSIDHKYAPFSRINRAPGSSLRNPTCDLALYLYDRGEKMNKAQLASSIQRLVDQHRFAIAGVRRPVPHESWYAVSGYFYLYGQQYAALVLDRLGSKEQRAYWPDIVRFTLKTRQPDGSFWDYSLFGYHKFYGTGYALIALSLCPKEIEGAAK